MALTFSPTPATGLPDGIAILLRFHNGSISRVSLPLWHCLSHRPPATDLPDGIAILLRFHNGSISRISLPLRHYLSRGTTDTNPLGHITFYFRHISTTAAISAFRCRCGIALLAAPLLQAFRTALPSCSSSTTAPFPAFRCRCGMAFFTVPPRFSAVAACLSHCSPTTDPLRHILLSPPFHNGTTSCISLPLRHSPSRGTTDTDSLGHILLSPPFHNGSISCISLRDSLPLRHAFPTVPLLQTPCATFSFRHLSTTAPFSAFRCRCGMTFLAAPLLQAFWTALPSCYASTTAAFLAFLCRCGIDFLTDPCYRPSGRHCHPVTLRKVSL